MDVDKVQILKMVAYERDIKVQEYLSRDDCGMKIGFRFNPWR
jgi:hypothetical protein